MQKCLKQRTKITPVALTEAFRHIWQTEETQEEWSMGLIMKLPKKGDLGNCNNWRGITLLSLSCKIFSRIILCRVRKAVDETLRQEQAGFRKGKSCVDQIFTIRQILEQSKEWNSTVYATYVDFEKAFDSLHRDSLWKIMRHYGIPQKLVKATQLLYTNFKSAVICENQLTEAFEIQTGVKQGCILSPFLFIMAIDWLMKTTTKGSQRGIRWTLMSCLEDLDFADDLSMLASRHRDMQGKLNDLQKNGEKIGLKIHPGKTKVMKARSSVEQPITLNGEDLEEVGKFVYLGSNIKADGDSETEVNTRIAKASYTFAGLKPVWAANKISTKTKIRIYKTNVLSVLLYACETWKMTKNISHKLEVFHNRCLRKLYKIYRPQI